MKKITPELVESLELCWDGSKAEQAAAEAGGKFAAQKAATPAEVLGMSHVSYEDAMYVVCQPEVAPEAALYEFAAQVAEELIPVAVKDYGLEFAQIETLNEAIAAARSGDAERIALAAKETHRVCRNAIMGDPDKSLSASLKSVRAAVKPEAGQAALGAGWHAAQSVKNKDPKGFEKEKASQRERLAQLVG